MKFPSSVAILADVSSASSCVMIVILDENKTSSVGSSPQLFLSYRRESGCGVRGESVYSAYRGESVYSIYSVYSVHSVYSVYSVYSVLYSAYSVYSVYSVYLPLHCNVRIICFFHIQYKLVDLHEIHLISVCCICNLKHCQ